MADDGYRGAERRANPAIIVQQADEKHWLHWVQAVMPAAVLLAGGAVAYGGIAAQMTAMVEALRLLQPLPVQVEQLRGDMNQQISRIASEQASRLADVSERVGRVETAAQRNRDQIDTIWQSVSGSSANSQQSRQP